MNMRIDQTRTRAVSEQPAAPPLDRLRLLIVLDALLVEGSVGRAGKRLGLGAPAMSRMLSQLRAFYGDELLLRTGKGMVATPFAEKLRNRLRALAAEADALLRPEPESRAPLADAPPMAMRRGFDLSDAPTPADLSRRLARARRDDSRGVRLAGYIATAGGGAGRSRPLTLDEAEDAFATILDGEAHPVQIGAFLLALQGRGLTAPELAGLVRAARAAVAEQSVSPQIADLDWPAYLSPKLPSAPWFIHSARLVARAGYRVLLHGQSRGITETASRAAGLPVAMSRDEAASALATHRIAFLPVGAAVPQLHRLFGLYPLMQLRSVVNSVVLLLNPGAAPTSLIGIPRSSERTLHREAAALLGDRHLTVIASNRDAGQLVPFRAASLLRLVNGARVEQIVPSVRHPGSAPAVDMRQLEYWQAVWNGSARDAEAEQIIIATAAVALMTAARELDDLSSAHERAETLWKDRARPAVL
ncbi:glycosyl transferase family protein [Rhodobacteraceae bacterium NNCM2]|nr:glycosyl transferase family protein [Coraliihabitans acroporae]